MKRILIQLLGICGLLILAPAFAIAAAPASSINWAGYATLGANITSVSGSWNIPTVTSSPQTSADATWVGIGGISSSDLIQTGTQAIDQNGSISYEAWYELLPGVSVDVPLTVHAGDSMYASLTEVGSGQWEVALDDHTTGQSFSTTVSYASSLSSAEWIEEMPSDERGYIPLDQFGSVSFSGASLIENGASMTAEEAAASPMTMAMGGTTLASPSALGTDGESFLVTRSSAAALVEPHYVTPDGRGGFRRGGQGISGYIPSSAPTVSRTYIIRRGGNGTTTIHAGFGNVRFANRFSIERN